MKVLNLLAAGNIGGIEILCKDIGALAPYDNLFCFVSDEGPIYEQMKQMKLNVESLAGRPKLSMFKLRKLIELAKTYDIIVVHHGEPFIRFYYCCLKKIYPSKKYVMTAHSCFEKQSIYYDCGLIKTSLGRKILKATIKSTDTYIFVSKAGMESYMREFDIIPKERSFVVYNGVGTDKLERGKRNEHKTGQDIKLLYVGRLVKVKGINLLIEAVSELKKRYNIRLTVVGDGPEREPLEKQADEFGISDIVSFVGKKTDVMPYLEDADIFVYPSVWEEVFGISIVEAMAFGLITVANRVGGIPEIIQDGVNGFLTDEKSANGIVNAIKKAITVLEKDAEETVRTEAKKTAEKFSIKETIKMLQGVLEKTLYN